MDGNFFHSNSTDAARFKIKLILGCAFFLHIALFVNKFIGVPDYGDSDIFQYVGYNISHGGKLYVTCWDNKGPVQFYMNGLSMMFDKIFFSLFWSIVACLIVFFNYKFLKSLFSPLYAAIGALIIGIAMVAIDPGGVGNRAEITCALWISVGLVCLSRTRRSNLLFFSAAQGCIVALLLMTKATYIGYGLFLIFLWTYSYIKKLNMRDYLCQIGGSLGGFLLGELLICLPLIIQHSFMQMVDAAFFFNAVEYCKGDNFYFVRFFCNLYRTWPLISIPGVIFLVLALRIVAKRPAPHREIAVGCCAWFVSELFLSCTSSTFFIWYLFPACFPFTIMGLYIISNGTFFPRLFVCSSWAILVLCSCLSIGRVQIHNLLNKKGCDEPGKYVHELGWINQPAVVLGGGAACRVAFQANIVTQNHYTVGALQYSQTNSPSRKCDMIHDACLAMSRAEHLIVEGTLECLPWYSHDEGFRSLCKEWHLAGQCNNILFYQRNATSAFASPESSQN